MSTAAEPRHLGLLLLVLSAFALLQHCTAAEAQPAAEATATVTETTLSDERVVFQTNWGDIEFAFLPHVAPVTAQHIFKLVTLGAYTGNHIFRVDKGFVAQVADVTGGRQGKLNKAQQAEGEIKVPLEVKQDVKHTEGVLSMGRYDDPNSGTSSFSFLLGAAPHLDMKYTIFGKVTTGMDVLHKLESLETRKEGIFVMPKERVHIYATYWYHASQQTSLKALSSSSSSSSSSGAVGASPGVAAGSSGYCGHIQEELDQLRARFDWQAEELHRVRHKCLPGT